MKKIALFALICLIALTPNVVSQSSNNCNLNGFVTFTQGGWGNPSNSTPGGIRDQYFNQVFPNGLIIGSGTKTITLTSAQAVQDFLPQGSTPTALTQSYVNPTSSHISVFAGQAAALTMNVFFDLNGAIGSNSTNLSDLVIVSGTFSGKTVSQLLSLVNNALGGMNTGYSLSDLNDAATAINENFDNGTTDEDYLTCPNEIQKASLGDKVWYDTNKNGIQDANENGVQNVVVSLYDCSGNFVKSTTTDGNGEYFFAELLPGDYKVKFNLPATYSFSTTNQGTNDNEDSDADVTTGFSSCITLADGENNLSVDAGIFVEEVTQQSDLSLTKTADKISAKNGDVVTFTVTVSNSGPNDATNVSAKDLLANGFDFSSALASQGNYNQSTGIWIIGTIASGSNATLTIACVVNIPNSSASPIDLGPAKGYNVFVLKDINQPSSDTEGKMAIGRDAFLANYSVGDKLPSSSGTVDALIVGRNLTFISGAVEGGNVVYGNSTNLPIYPVSYVDGTLRQDSPIDFASAAAYLQNLSAELSVHPVNGTTTLEWGGVFMNGTDPFLNTFSVNGSDLSTANNVEINVPNGSVVLVNVNGNTVSWGGGFVVRGTAINNVLYNFYEATSLKIEGIDVTGSILAPFAHVNFVTGVQNGQMICKSLEGRGQFNNVQFIGNIPTTSTIPNVAEVMSADQNDPDSAPGNGVVTEDDYASLFVTIESDEDAAPAQGLNLLSSLNNTSAVLSITSDRNNNLITGTSDGKIYRSTSSVSEIINADMKVKTVWSVNSNNAMILAGTEKGLYASKDNGTTWQMIGLEKKDVRSVTVDANGTIYAATWGEGLFVSKNEGTSWEAANSGLENLKIQNILLKNNQLIAATYGGGIYHSVDAGNSWTKSTIDCNFIWSLTSSPNGNLYAATYGNGVYKSEDNGMNWTKLGNNQKAEFIYSVSVDKNETVYASGLSSEMYSYTAANGEWKSISLPKEEVSSIYINETDAVVYAGTKKGSIYSVTNSTTAVENNSEMPTEFSLSQNYPNPFNPTTTIQFTVVKQEVIKLVIYNTLGEEVKTLINANYAPGKYTVAFDASEFASGLYIYRISNASRMITKKMMLLK